MAPACPASPAEGRVSRASEIQGKDRRRLVRPEPAIEGSVHHHLASVRGIVVEDPQDGEGPLAGRCHYSEQVAGLHAQGASQHFGQDHSLFGQGSVERLRRVAGQEEIAAPLSMQPQVTGHQRSRPALDFHPHLPIGAHGRHPWHRRQGLGPGQRQAPGRHPGLVAVRPGDRGDDQIRHHRLIDPEFDRRAETPHHDADPHHEGNRHHEGRDRHRTASRSLGHLPDREPADRPDPPSPSVPAAKPAASPFSTHQQPSDQADDPRGKEREAEQQAEGGGIAEERKAVDRTG